MIAFMPTKKKKKEGKKEGRKMHREKNSERYTSNVDNVFFPPFFSQHTFLK